MLFSYDNGSIWHWINEYGLANVAIYAIQYQQSTQTVFAFTHGRGVYTSVTTTTGTSGFDSGFVSSTIWEVTSGDGVPMTTTTTGEAKQQNNSKFGVFSG
jgi:hypothetical protein